MFGAGDTMKVRPLTEKQKERRRIKGREQIARIKHLESENPNHPGVIKFRASQRKRVNKYHSKPGMRERKLEITRAWNVSNPEKVKEYRKLALTPEKRAIRNEKAKIAYGDTPRLRIENCLRVRFYTALKRLARGIDVKLGSIFGIMGCEPKDVMTHLESKFQPGMAWSNYGFRGWHVDHIIPLAAFDLNNIEAQQEAFSLNNIQPLWMQDNLRKHSKIINEFPLPARQLAGASQLGATINVC